MGATVYGDFPATEEGLLAPGFDHAPVVSVNLPGWESSEVADVLGHDYDIAVRAGGHCAPRMHRALSTQERALSTQETGAVRFSFGCFTTERDVDAALAALAELVSEGEGGDDATA